MSIEEFVVGLLWSAASRRTEERMTPDVYEAIDRFFISFRLWRVSRGLS